MPHPAFELIRRERVPSLAIAVEEYRHRSTGAAHIHLAADDDNNAFLVAFRTVPQDSTGVAHILEHVSLCGSARYPVRDPFFMMLRRSLNTFMNAFTASDWTAYPFASQNRKDFDNLLQVYLDAAFFPRLDPLDFAQEGHRFEFEDPQNPQSDLAIRGVVYNEMKGAMSSPIAQVAQSLQSHLFPTITYHYNSGGDPEEIPRLSYDQLKAFHAKHYHPSNAVFMTYGNFPVEDHQTKFEECALVRCTREDLDIRIPDERRYDQPQAVEDEYSVSGNEDTGQRSHVLMGWLLGKSADLKATMDAHVLAGVLLDNSASPLRQALETSDLGSAPSELCGLDDSTREATFICGLEGSDPDKAEAVEHLVLNVLEDVVQKGVPRDQVESVLHQVELGQREVGGGRFPYGLQLMVRALPAFLHGGDPVAFLNIDPVLTELRGKIKDSGFIRDLTRRELLDNPHRVRLTMVPDPALSARQAELLSQRLRTMKDAMDEDQGVQLVEAAATLKSRQESEDDPELLPKVGLADIPRDRTIPKGRAVRVDGMPLTWFGQGTNGLVYQQIVADLPQLAPELVDQLPLFCDCISEVGSGERDYLETQAWHAAVSGGIQARISLRAHVGAVERLRAVFVLAGKALVRNERALANVLRETLLGARFDELSRLRELVAQLRAQEEATVTDRGHSLAISAATSSLGPWGSLNHRWHGLEGLRRLKGLDDALADESELKALGERLTRIRDAILEARRQLLVVSEPSLDRQIGESLAQEWAHASSAAKSPVGFSPQRLVFGARQAWSVNTEVNFCAKAYPTVPESHADAPALMVLGPFLTNGFLHRAIREQGGAYGAGAGYSSDAGAMRFFSYRDPRLGETFEDFDRALDWLQSEAHEPRQLEEAILRVVSDIDRPESPAGEAMATFFGSLHGRTPEQRRQFRLAILDVGLQDLERVAADYLVPDTAAVAVVSNEKILKDQGDLGLEVHKL